jgi:hypothetical protein
MELIVRYLGFFRARAVTILLGSGEAQSANLTLLPHRERLPYLGFEWNRLVATVVAPRQCLSFNYLLGILAEARLDRSVHAQFAAVRRDHIRRAMSRVHHRCGIEGRFVTKTEQEMGGNRGGLMIVCLSRPPPSGCPPNGPIRRPSVRTLCIS